MVHDRGRPRLGRRSASASTTSSAMRLELGEEGAVTIVGHGIGSNPAVINKARASAVGAGVPLNAVSVSPLRVTLWCDRPHVDNLVRALHKTFIDGVKNVGVDVLVQSGA